MRMCSEKSNVLDRGALTPSQLLLKMLTEWPEWSNVLELIASTSLPGPKEVSLKMLRGSLVLGHFAPTPNPEASSANYQTYLARRIELVRLSDHSLVRHNLPLTCQLPPLKPKLFIQSWNVLSIYFPKRLSHLVRVQLKHPFGWILCQNHCN